MNDREFTNYELADAEAWIDLRVWARESWLRKVTVEYESTGDGRPVAVYLKTRPLRAVKGRGKTLASASRDALRRFEARKARGLRLVHSEDAS